MSMSLNLVFQQGDPCNTVLVRSDDGSPLYRSSTPFKLLGKSITKVVRIRPDGSEEEIARIKWEDVCVDDTEIAEYGGEWRKIRTFMAQRRQFS